MKISQFWISLLALFTSLTLSNAFAEDIEITDIKDNVIKITKVNIDYTVYPSIGFYTPDFDYNGIRLHQGSGIVKVAWSKIDKIINIEEKTSMGFSKLTGSLIFNNGLSKDVELVWDSGKGLRGEMDIGDFSIRLSDIKTITVLRATGRKQSEKKSSK